MATSIPPRRAPTTPAAPTSPARRPRPALAPLAALLAGLLATAGVAPVGLAEPAAQSAPGSIGAVHFVSPEQGWIAGAPAGGSGAILMTKDGGGSWTPQYSGPETIRALTFISPRVGWALATDALLGTTNGGAEWTLLSQPSPPLLAVSFASETVGWGVQAAEGGGPGVPYGAIVVTQDGGRTWSGPTTPGTVQSVCFTDHLNGWAAGGFTVWRTTDGGQVWNTVFTSPVSQYAPPGGGPPRQQTAEVQCAGEAAWVRFDGPGGMMHSSWALYHSPDGGQTWRAVVQSNQFPPTGAATGWGTDGARLNAVSATTAYVVQVCSACSPPGGSAAQMGTVALGVTKDGGATWQNLPVIPGLVGSGVLQNPPAVSMLPSGHGWLVAPSVAGAVFRTTDGGASWTQAPIRPG